MLSLIAILLIMAAGAYLRRYQEARVMPWAGVLQQSTLFFLTLYTICLFSHPLASSDLWLLLTIGFSLQAVPSLLGFSLLKQKKSIGRDFIEFSTYGGGNRGVLLLSLLEPQWLPIFIGIDLGNFISLLLLFPILARRGEQGETSPARQTLMKSWRQAAITMGCVGLGLFLETVNVPVPAPLETILKVLLTTSIALHLGLHFSPRLVAPGRLLRRLLGVRAVGVGITVFAYTVGAFFLGGSSTPAIWATCLIFLILPTSSIAPMFLSPGAWRDQVMANVIATSTVFIALLLGLSGLKIIASVFF